jgi:hypothetical protein
MEDTGTFGAMERPIFAGRITPAVANENRKQRGSRSLTFYGVHRKWSASCAEFWSGATPCVPQRSDDNFMSIVSVIKVGHQPLQIEAPNAGNGSG